MASFEQTKTEFLAKWAQKEGATTQTVEDMKKAFAGFQGLLKYRGIGDDLSQLDSTLVDHYCEMTEEKGIARVDLERIRGVMMQFVEYAKSQSAAKPAVAKLAVAKSQAQEKPPAAKPKPKKVTMKLGLLIFIDLVWIAAVVYFMFVTPNLSGGLQRTLIAFLAILALILMVGLFRFFRALF
ncbi:hypothetical protein ACFLT7_04840 [candidate division KSB1 bacterium]